MPPDALVKKYASLLQNDDLDGPVLDLACGRGQNGLYVAELGLPVILADRSADALKMAQDSAREKGVQPEFWEVDLESGVDPLPVDHFHAILVFRYLHRPLIPKIRQAVREGGIVIYETFTDEQPKYGKPHNPDFLLRPGELAAWFEDWEVIHSFEGLLEAPRRAAAQVVCRKPFV